MPDTDTDREDFFALYQVMKKAERGEPVTAAFLGGSVTQGSKASLPENCYAALTCKWLRERFPRAEIRYVNAGMGATGSLIGAHRLEPDVLAHRPDLVFVEFAVNDRNAPDDREAYESVVSRLLGEAEPPAVLALFMGKEDGYCVQEQQKTICRRYGLPTLSIRDAVQNGIGAGNFQWEELYADDVHPNDAGHRLISQMIVRLLESVLHGEEPKAPSAGKPEAPVYGDCFSRGRILDAAELVPVRAGSFVPCGEKFQCFRHGWVSPEDAPAGLPFTVRMEARNIYLIYRRGVSPFYGKAEAGVSGGPHTEIDSLFRGGWGDYAEVSMLAREAEKKDYTVEIRKLSGVFVIFGFLVS